VPNIQLAPCKLLAYYSRPHKADASARSTSILATQSNIKIGQGWLTVQVYGYEVRPSPQPNQSPYQLPIAPLPRQILIWASRRHKECAVPSFLPFLLSCSPAFVAFFFKTLVQIYTIPINFCFTCSFSQVNSHDQDALYTHLPLGPCCLRVWFVPFPASHH